MGDLSVDEPTLHPVEHEVLRNLRKAESDIRPLFVAVSGGLDSMALAHILKRLQPLLKNSLCIAHIHHGFTSENRQRDFRERAQSFVRKWADQVHLPFVTNDKQKSFELNSEQEMREFRYETLFKLMSGWLPKAQLVLAHHQDDLVETQILRMIRGTGPQGLKSMSVSDGKKVRPLLTIRRRDLQKYAEEMQLRWLDDPSNKDLNPLRNWLRHDWLPRLETKRPGALKSMARSMMDLVETSGGSAALFVTIVDEKISHPLFLELSPSDQRRVLARYLRLNQVSGYGRSHIEEILKRLDSGQKNLRFTLLRREWVITPEWIMIRGCKSS